MANVNNTVLVTSSIAIIISLLVYTYWKKNKKPRVPTVWEPVAKVKQLFIYPVKSGHQIELQSAITTKFGFKTITDNKNLALSDRSFIIYKDDFVFVTGRQYPKLIFIKIRAVDEEHFALSAPEMHEVKVAVPNYPKGKKLEQVTIHKGEKINTIDCGDDVAKWISSYVLGIDKGLRLGFYDDSFRRDISIKFKDYFKFYPFLSNEASGMYSDLSSYLLLNQASVNELSSRIPEANITARNFRPNILVEGENLKPFEEDNWRWIKIGDAVFYMAKYCTRCIFTTINPETGVKSECTEPLTTLRRYRRLKDISNVSVDGDLTVMGLNLGLQTSGVINVGDVVYVGKN